MAKDRQVIAPILATPHFKDFGLLAAHLVRSIQQLQLHRHEFEVLFIYIPHHWNSGFVGGSNDDFDLHDHLKATTAALGLPIQVVREDSATALSLTTAKPVSCGGSVWPSTPRRVESLGNWPRLTPKQPISAFRTPCERWNRTRLDSSPVAVKYSPRMVLD